MYVNCLLADDSHQMSKLLPRQEGPGAVKRSPESKSSGSVASGAMLFCEVRGSFGKFLARHHNSTMH